MLEPRPLQPGETYGTVADIRDCPDLPELPFCPGERMADGSFQPYWHKANGEPVVVLVRAPSLAERRLIEQAVPDEKDTMGWVLETCFYCLKEPKLTREQLQNVLTTKHAEPLIQISDRAWQLAGLPATVLTTALRELAGLPKEKAKDAGKPPASTPRVRRKKADPAPAE